MNSTLSKAWLLTIAMAASLHAATIDGTVTNKTTGKPSAGDKVALVDFSAGMSETATATTNAAGQYTLQAPSSGSYLIRVDHQGASYFIAAPQNNSAADVTVYDVVAKVEGVGIDADMLLIEAGQGTLHVRERYLVRNPSSPPRTQFSDNTFEIVLPEDAQFEEAAATRPGGMGTRTHLVPRQQKGRYSFNVPIQPNQGEKETMFEVSYHFPYSGRHSFTVHPIAPADHFVVYTAQGINFAAKDASRFKAAQEDARVETHVALNSHPGEEIAFTISGEGRMPPDTNVATMQFAGSNADVGKGGAIEAPNGSPDPMTDSNGWLLLGGAILLTGAALLILRRQKEPDGVRKGPPLIGDGASDQGSAQNSSAAVISHSSGSSVLLETLKEELFALEQDNVSGRVPADEYANTKAGLEAVLKRALNSQSH